MLERAHELLPVENSSYGVLSAFVELQRSLDKEAILKALNLRSAKLSPPLQLIEMVLRADGRCEWRRADAAIFASSWFYATQCLSRSRRAPMLDQTGQRIRRKFARRRTGTAMIRQPRLVCEVRSRCKRQWPSTPSDFRLTVLLFPIVVLPLVKRHNRCQVLPGAP